MINTDSAARQVLVDAGVTAFVETPADPLARLPFVVLRPLPGSSAWPGRHELVQYRLTAYADSRRAARDLAVEAVKHLFDAYMSARLQLVDASRATPDPVPSGLEGVWRFDIPVTVATRA